MPSASDRPAAGRWGVAFSAVLQMASLASPSRQQQAPLLPLDDAVASATARRLFPLVEREDLTRVAAAASAGPCSITCVIGCGWRLR